MTWLSHPRIQHIPVQLGASRNSLAKEFLLATGTEYSPKKRFKILLNIILQCKVHRPWKVKDAQVSLHHTFYCELEYVEDQRVT